MVQEGRPTSFTRKDSFRNALNKLTDKANSLGHRRRMTSATLSSNSSLISASITQPHQSRLPNPSGIPRSNSFFGSLNSIGTPNIDEQSNLSIPDIGGVRRYRKVSEKFIQLPFFSRQHQSNAPQRPLCSRTKRESSIRIEHRGLMAPIQPASMPRSSTMGNISQERSVITSPSFMRPTGSSTNHRRQNTTSSHQGQSADSQSRSSNTTFLNPPAPRLPRHSPNRPTVKSGPPNECITPSASSSKICFPTRRDSLACQSSPPTRPVAPAAKPFSSTDKAGTMHQSSLPRSARMPAATRIPTPVESLLTPEYEDIDEDERDKRATYDETHLQGEEGDEGETTMTQETDEAETLCRIKCNRSHLDRPHRQTSDLQHPFHTVPREEDFDSATEHFQHTHQCADPDKVRFVGPTSSPFAMPLHSAAHPAPRSAKPNRQHSGSVDIPPSQTISVPKAFLLSLTHLLHSPPQPSTPTILECSTTHNATSAFSSTSPACARQRTPSPAFEGFKQSMKTSTVLTVKVGRSLRSNGPRRCRRLQWL